MINVIAVTLAAICLYAGDVASERPPVIKQFEVDEQNNVIKPYEGVDEKLSEIIVENVENIRLECHADYPVQWIYTGSGILIVQTSISLASPLSSTERRKNRFNLQYVASIFLGPIKEHHAGNYQCSRTNAVTSVPNLYVYVPGQDLFTSTRGKTIRINPDVSSILIPCSVSDPRVKVSLFKLEGDVLKKPVTKSDDAIIYDPRKGFRINLRKVEDIEGRYLCTAFSDKNDIRDLEYTITAIAKTEEIQSEAPVKYEGLSPDEGMLEHSERAISTVLTIDRTGMEHLTPIMYVEREFDSI